MLNNSALGLQPNVRCHAAICLHIKTIKGFTALLTAFLFLSIIDTVLYTCNFLQDICNLISVLFKRHIMKWSYRECGHHHSPCNQLMSVNPPPLSRAPFSPLLGFFPSFPRAISLNPVIDGLGCGIDFGTFWVWMKYSDLEATVRRFVVNVNVSQKSRVFFVPTVVISNERSFMF